MVVLEGGDYRWWIIWHEKVDVVKGEVLSRLGRDKNYCIKNTASPDGRLAGGECKTSCPETHLVIDLC